jgi:hypothetical protein
LLHIKKIKVKFEFQVMIGVITNIG